MQPEQANFLLHQFYLPGVRNEQRITKSIIEAIPLDKGDYRPDEISKSAVDLAWHIAVSEMMFLDAVCNAKFEFPSNTRPDAVKNSADVARWYEENFAARVARLEQTPTETLTTDVDFGGFMRQPGLLYLSFLLHHSVHHRGQLSMYLRPMGAKVPSIYGPSYDTQQAAKQNA
ncbi:MAG TPA: DinB family protein [Bryobacteraceae bacterium]|nr:DinB family protein [Bryobacteraceae bacterium]